MRMKNLQVINVPAQELFRLFSHLSFPQLLRCIVPLAPDIFPFLRANCMITSLYVVPSWELEGSSAESPMESIYMPKLQRFSGPEIVACCVLPGSPASQVAIAWPKNPAMEYSRGLVAAASSQADVDILCTLVHSWDLALLAAIAKHAPRRLRVLQIQNIMPFSATFPKEYFLSAIDDTLRSLSCLRAISIVQGFDSRPVHWNEEDLESEFQTVRRWREICPSIGIVTLSTITSWICIRSLNVWLPANANGVDVTSVPCLKWFVKKTLTSSALPPEYRFWVDSVVGADKMKALEEALERDGVVPPFDILYQEDGGPSISFAIT
ncbi:hypothetical protein B0H19DRAFT_1158870 [Mycena capillaripes]|nr:hypothetical protein B0H19DRAFT_1158870 [Mycena capillaripes]